MILFVFQSPISIATVLFYQLISQTFLQLRKIKKQQDFYGQPLMSNGIVYTKLKKAWTARIFTLQDMFLQQMKIIIAPAIFFTIKPWLMKEPISGSD